MRLIFLKTHLKDGAMSFHLDERKGQAKIGDLYDWEQLHHIHNFVRCFYTGCSIQKNAVGSLLVLPVEGQLLAERFDFGDLHLPQTMFIRLDKTAILTVFDDAGGALSCFNYKLERFTGPVSELQLREVSVELAWLNLHLKERPTLGVDIDTANETCRMTCERPPELRLNQLDYDLRGRLFQNALGHVFPHVKGQGLTAQETLEAVKAGTFTFLFDNDGNFITEVDRSRLSASF
jgi:hypothetical protein